MSTRRLKGAGSTLFALDPRAANSPTSSLSDEARANRRVFLAGTLAALASALSGCGSSTAHVAPSKPTAPLLIRSLDQLVPLPGLRWLVAARPKDIAAIAWLEPSISMLLDKERLDRSAEQMGFDLRTLPEAAWAAYRTENGGEDASLQLVRHLGNSLAIERLFRERLSADMLRIEDDPRIIRVTGRLGKTVHAFASIGNDVVCLQQDGSLDRGPCRVATLLALGKLKRIKPVFADEALRVLAKRFESAPLRIYAPGPFEGDLARGARGLLAAATAIGAAFRPSPHESLLVEIAVAGDFTTSGPAAAQKLAASWDDLAARPLGHLLGLDAPLSPPFPTFAPDMVTLAVDLDPRKVAKGLADATSNQIREIMQ